MCNRGVLLAAGALLVLVSGLPARADVQATEVEKSYAVSGSSGIDLYRSIGARGPLLGETRAIAHTTFDLKWSRDYRPQPDGSCRLVSTKPWLTITYTLPKPSGQLAEPLASLWKSFITGMRAHEKVHGEHIRDLTKRTLDATLGLGVPDDPKCQKVRKEVARLALEASLEQRARSRDFDRMEMSEGGNVHRLILALVNGR